ncbi:unnamed protein product [Prorocentrum cordatum]|uniref:Uncharacterized protein n=1 Tax=Prorocentrum cordatum TaxID=2364126 RepID=A0ABN9QUQ9_9DINO|nr:unnamed protein product [Polarella glacialis]
MRAGDRYGPRPGAMPPAGADDEETRRVAALLLRGAREQEERAQETSSRQWCPSRAQRWRLSRRAARGMLGALVRRSSQENLAVVRLGRGLGAREVELPLDDVCEYA